jgi:hypothetical protein
METQALENYLYDLGYLMKEKALQARETMRSSKGSSQYDYDSGYLMAYHEVISLFQEQATVFGISLEKLRLEDIDPEKDLI